MFYTKLNESELMMSLSSRCIYNKLIYKYPPITDENHFLFEFRLYSYEIKQMELIGESTYILNKPINFENRCFSILCKDENQVLRIEKIKSIYLEIKDIDNYMIKIISNLKQYNNEDKTSIKNHIKNNDAIYEYRLKRNNEFDKIKGAIYMVFCHYINLKLDAYDKYSIFKEEIDSLKKIINNIKNKNMHDREMYINSNKLLRILENKNIKYAEDNIYLEDIFYSIDYRIHFKYELIDISYQEYVFLSGIFSFIVKKNREELKIEEIVLISKELIKNKTTQNDLKDDIDILCKRVLEQDFAQNINEIKSDIIKNLFAFCIHYNDQHNLYNFLNTKNINRKHIGYALYGAFHGYSKIPNSLVSDEYIYTDTNKKLLLKSIGELDHLFFNLKNTSQYTRDRTHYLIINLLNDYLDIFIKNNLEIKNYSIKYNKNNKLYDTLIITNNNIDFIVIEFWKREGKIAKSVKYFDDRTNRIRQINENLVLKNDYIFSYHFIQNNKSISLNLMLEEKYMIILNDLLIHLKREEIF